MKARIALLFTVILVCVSAFANSASAYNPQSYCQSWQSGQLEKNPQGVWFICRYDPTQPTGFGWHRLG